MTDHAVGLNRYRSAPADPSEPPELHRAASEARQLAARAAARLPRGASAAGVAALSRRSPPDRIATRLDQFMARMRGNYRVGGHVVQVTPHFRSRYEESEDQTERFVLHVKHALGEKAFRPIAMNAARAVRSRGYPEDVQVVTQALIDAGALDKYPGLPPQQAIRRLMWDLKLGFDCRGYVARALLYSRGTGIKEASLARYADKDIGNVEFPTTMMRRVSVAQAKPGDVIHLKPPKDERDHNVIVRSNSLVRFPGVGHLEVRGRTVPEAFVRDGWPAGSNPSVRVLEVDSSWGGGPRGDFGGVERRAWLHNEKSDLWAYWEPDGTFRITPGPYDHELDGVFRPRNEP